MFILLSKILPLFIYPLGLSCCLLLLALFLKNRPKITRVILVLAVLVLWIGSNQWAAAALTYSLESQFPAAPELTQTSSPNDEPLAEAIVLLGGGTRAHESPRPLSEVNEAGDRLFYAAYLYKQGKADHILVTGGRIEWLGASVTTPAEEMAELLEMMGVPREALWLEDQSQNTYENAVYSHQILAKKGIRRIILVTSAMHMPRSIKLFEQQGFEVIPAPTDFTITERGWAQMFELNLVNQFLNLMPSAYNLSQLTSALKEYIGMFVYSLRGWL